LPVANGVLAVENYADAEARAGGAHGNKGEEAALAALEMAWLLHKLNPVVMAAARMGIEVGP
jgi:6,7-dimethyl-8-ribityllumazine synthase